MALTGERQAWRSKPARVIWAACLGTAIAPAGIQGIAPAIPAIQDQYGLSVAQVSLITSVFLLPSIFSAFGAGVLADRIGVRAVFAGSLVLFGAGGLVLLFEHTLTALLAVRVVQGAAFGAILALSVAVIGAVAPSGVEAARGQSRRVITLEVAQALLPAAAGVLVGVAWYAPFALQVLALPAALLVWTVLPARVASEDREPRGGVGAVLRAPALVGVQVLGALRFVFKFAVLTYFPVLAVGALGFSPVGVGAVMSVEALLAACAAWGTHKLVGRWWASQLIGMCLVVTALAMAGLGVAGAVGDGIPLIAVVALWLYGLQDGVFGVAHNVLVTEMAPEGVRATYVGLTGTTRNTGKFVAPLLFGAATLALSVAHTFMLLAGSALLALTTAHRVARVQAGQAPPTNPRGEPPS